MTIRAPKFGNVFRTDSRMIVRHTSDGDLIAFVPSDHQPIKQWSAEFEALTDQEVTGLMGFLEETCGELVDFTDHEGHNWHGMFVTENIVFHENGICKWVVALEFEGEDLGHP